MSVKLLDMNTINKIAAGEVVERPASVVKELVENAIDAGSTRIVVEIQNGGKTYIKVTDNGSGMNREDASLSIRSHATSKLTSVKDLETVSTLGFRGEALPTIAAVSKFSLWTRQAGSELGTLVQVTGGHDQMIEPQGCAVGTTVLVEDLFFNTPARKKFLKQTATESNKINEFLTKLAMSRPSIAFKLLNGSKMVLNTPGSGSLIECAESIYGRDMTQSMMTIDFQDRFNRALKINGLISRPNVVKSYRSCQTFIINGRVVGSRTIGKAVEEAYKSLVPKGTYPLAILTVTLPPTTVDVNVHPQKSEVRFEDESQVYRAVHTAVTQALEEKKFIGVDEFFTNEELYPSSEPSPKVEPKKNIPEPKIKVPKNIPESEEFISSREFESEEKISEPELEEKNSASELEIEEKVSEPELEIEEKNSEPKVESEESTSASELELFARLPNKIMPIGQVALCYIVAKDESNLYIVDQHAAHERIIFDRLSGSVGGIAAQQILVPETLEFDAREAQIIDNNLELFRQLGFTLERGGDGGYRLMEVPVDVIDGDSEGILREILSSLPTIDDSFGDDEQQRKVIAKNIREACLATTACRAAIKAGQELNMRQMQIILDELYRTKYPFTCPHGRPTIRKFTEDELANMFKRKGF